MCVICVSKIGVAQPTKAVLREMFDNNSHGGGFMFARDNIVEIHKGFMTFEDYWKAISSFHFTKADAVVYHTRISTQAGVNPEMTHPFPLSKKKQNMKALDLKCSVGVAHNGIVRMTSNNDKEYSDTALFIADYMTKLIRTAEDIESEEVAEMISALTNSKWAILRKDGYIQTVGSYYEETNGLLYSNHSYQPYKAPKRFTFSNVKISDITNMDF